MRYEGQTYKLLGRGHSCIAYRNEDTVLVFEPSDDYAKELYSLADSSTHIPPVTKLETDWKVTEHGNPLYGRLYRMPYIPSMKSAPKELKQLMNEAEQYRLAAWGRFNRDEKYMLFEVLAIWFDEHNQATIAEDLRVLGSWATAYGSSWTLELKPDSLGYLDGRVILRDVVFDAASLVRRLR